ncbi:MAG: hypothetical protein R6V46_16915 [Desulfatiglandaceae bacterium]
MTPTYQRAIEMLPDGAVMAECGPMRLVISAAVGKVTQRETAVQAAETSFTYLERIARLRGVLSRRMDEIPKDLEDSLGLQMVRSVLAVGDEDLTPMAAVAGTIADAVADYLFARGMSKVVVDNGGDVAVRLRRGASVRVGIRPEVGRQDITVVIALDSRSGSWGVTTSGFGGRSLTRGVASAVTVIARSASVADAASTAIANASFVTDDGVIQRRAEEIEPETDLVGLPVTVKVAQLAQEKKIRAVSNAIKRAEALIDKDIIFGAFVAVQGEVAMTRFFRDCLVNR